MRNLFKRTSERKPHFLVRYYKILERIFFHFRNMAAGAIQKVKRTRRLIRKGHKSYSQIDLLKYLYPKSSPHSRRTDFHDGAKQINAVIVYFNFACAAFVLWCQDCAELVAHKFPLHRILLTNDLLRLGERILSKRFVFFCAAHGSKFQSLV